MIYDGCQTKLVPEYLTPAAFWAVPSLTYDSQLVYRKGLVFGGTISPFFLMKREPAEKVVIPPWSGVAAGTAVSRARLLFLASVQDASESMTLQEWVPLLEALAKAGEGLVLVTNALQNKTILAALLVNNYRSVMQCVVVTQGNMPGHWLDKLYPKVLHRKEGLFHGSGKSTTQKVSEIEREGLPLFEEVWTRKDASVAIPRNGNREWDDLLSDVASLEVSGYNYEDYKQRFETIAQEISIST